MNNLREVNDNDILKRWYDCMEDAYLCYMTAEDAKHNLNFDRFSENILKNVSKPNKKYIEKQLDLIYEDFMNYVTYITEKYYRNGFVDGVQLIVGCVEE